TSPNEVIFSNVLITEGRPYWLGDGRDIPEKGVNYSGKWHKGKTDEKGKEITHSHKNARYTVGLSAFKNADSRINDPGGVAINGVIYGGRDSDTSPPLQQSFDWQHGVITMAASLESETTAATLGREGVRQFNPMSNLDFLYIPLGRYIDNYLKFVEGIALPPPIFSVNYFIRGKDGQYLTAMEDKRVWLKWAGLRVEGEAGAIETPTGYIPEYEDLRRLFRDVLDKDYDKQDYDQQFVLRVEENLRKIKRIGDIYKTQVADAPEVLFEALDKQAARLKDVKAKYGDYVLPGKFI
ncbi:MAG: phosphoenolpyruvate carboxykinase domain-containing protein, partial [Candidatus Omnitrophota bacterium]